eukprot:CAMPEP_0198229566 /NCGR_PEP_ID=MMETSP1445-20131203/114190_1 /TAXON_ID=36898 /ORGANISM="Pyramimonas sp., Strain CCMP2087" /LENGTH=275 /DNA_ID=CAMNT_0043910029 /DNA_START=409 /DNA_END=1236 /DNA_ORIENTATION=+
MLLLVASALWLGALGADLAEGGGLGRSLGPGAANPDARVGSRSLLKSSSSASKKKYSSSKSSSSSSSGKHSKQKPEHHEHPAPAVPTAPAFALTPVPPYLPYVGLPSSMQGKYGEVPRNFFSAVPVIASNSVVVPEKGAYYSGVREGLKSVSLPDETSQTLVDSPLPSEEPQAQLPNNKQADLLSSEPGEVVLPAKSQRSPSEVPAAGEPLFTGEVSGPVGSSHPEVSPAVVEVEEPTVADTSHEGGEPQAEGVEAAFRPKQGTFRPKQRTFRPK